MSKYELKNLNEIAEIEGDLAKCKVCGELKPLRGIGTHYFRKHSIEGMQHTEKVKNFLKEQCILNVGRKIKCTLCNKEIGFSAFKNHEIVCKKRDETIKLVIGKECEACHLPMTSLYGSGRFCSVSCATGSCARPNKKEANRKTSLALKGRKVLDKKTNLPLVKEFNNTCIVCSIDFISRKIEKKYCSRKCYNKSDEKREMMSISMKRVIERGNPFPKRIKCEFSYKNSMIRCDSRLEWTFLTWVVRNFDLIDLKRSDVRISYTLDGKDRIFHPDFEFMSSEGLKYLVEVKSVQSPKNPAWIQYNRESEEKQKVLDLYCQENGYQTIWFTQKTDSKFYRKACIEFDNTVRNNTF
jgi:hypothetical protein